MPAKLTTIALTAAMLALSACSDPLVPLEPMPEPAGQVPGGDSDEDGGIDV